MGITNAQAEIQTKYSLNISQKSYYKTNLFTATSSSETLVTIYQTTRCSQYKKPQLQYCHML
jgi:hypothetical protein